MGKLKEDYLKHMGYFIMGIVGAVSILASYAGKEDKELQYRHQVDSIYNIIVLSKTKDVSLIKILNQYTPFTEKEKIVKGNKLEKEIK